MNIDEAVKVISKDNSDYQELQEARKVISEFVKWVEEQDLIRREDALEECCCHYDRTCLGTGETCMECEHYSAEGRYIRSIPRAILDWRILNEG